MLAGAAHAQEPAGTFKAVLDVGLVNVAGNTEVTTLNVGETVSFAWSGWVVAQTFSVVYGRTSGVTTASQWKAGIRGDRKYGERISTYLAGGFERNTFAGIDRRFEEAVGLAALLLKTERDELAVEAGGSLNQQRSTAGVRSSFPAARGAARFRHGFSNQAFVQQAVEALPNLEETDDLRLNAETQLVAPLSTQVGLKLSYVIRLDNLPEPGFRKTDRILTAGVQIVF
jgi:putative salt-induced outer membrane protein YdiY